MNQSRAFFVSLVFALVGMALVAFYISEETRKITQNYGSPKKVLIATKNINEMQELDETMFEVQEKAEFYLQPGVATNPEDVKGMVALVPIAANEQIVLNKLSPKSAETGLALQVAASKRAMSIAVDDVSAVTKLIKPGDHVDIIGSIRYPAADGSQQTELKTLLQNVNLLAVGEVIQNNIPKVYETDALTQKKVAVSGRGDRGFATVTVEVTPEQSQILLFAMAQDTRLYLTLRNPIDRVENAVGTTTVDEVLGSDSKRAEARDREQRRILEEAQRAAAEAAARAANTQQGAKRAPASVDPLESGGGVLE